MHVLHFEVRNVKGVRLVKIDPDPTLVKFSGANGSGKSSNLDAVWMCLKGRDSIPMKPIRDGEESAHVTLHIGDTETEYVITRTFELNEEGETTTEINVMSPKGAKYGKPQTLIDAKCGVLSFDPLKFARMSSREQRDLLAARMGLTDMLKSLAAADKEDFDARTIVNREAKAAQARLDAMPTVEACEPVVMSELLVEIREARNHNVMIERERQRRDDIERAIAQKFDRAGALRLQAEQLMADAQRLLEEAERDDEAFETLPAIAKRANVEALEQLLEEAEAVNAQHQQFMERAKAVDIVARLKAESNELTDRMATREAERAAVIQSANLPVPGLGFGEDHVTFNGIPLSQTSGGEGLRVALALAISENPEFRILRVQEWPLLDEVAQAETIAWARENRVQLWVEDPTTNASDGYVMQDGTVREASAVATVPTRRSRRTAVGA